MGLRKGRSKTSVFSGEKRQAGNCCSISFLRGGVFVIGLSFLSFPRSAWECRPRRSASSAEARQGYAEHPRSHPPAERSDPRFPFSLVGDAWEIRSRRSILPVDHHG